MPGSVAMITCGGCGKSVPWKPEYAGKRLRCKCGFSMVGPPQAPLKVSEPPKPSSTLARASSPQPLTATPAAATQSSGSDDPFEQLVSQAEEYSLAVEPAKTDQKSKSPTYRRPRPPTAQPVRAGVASAAAVAGPTSPILGYARAVSKPIDEGSKGAATTDIYIPVALIVVGLIARYLDSYIRGLHDPLMMSVYVIITCTINLMLIFAALMIGVKLLDLGLGSIGPAMLKICAVAILPAAAGDMIAYYTIGLVGWGATLLMYYGLLIYLFDLDGQEMWIICAIVWAMKWLSFFILVALFASMGMGLRASNSSVGTKATPLLMTGSGDEPAQADPDKLAADEIRNGTAVEFRKWIKVNTHGVLRGSQMSVAKDAESYYAAGAKAVWAMEIEKKSSNIEICHDMVIELPDDPKAKKAVRKAIYGEDLPDSDEDPDAGKKFIHVKLD